MDCAALVCGIVNVAAGVAANATANGSLNTVGVRRMLYLATEKAGTI